jgi:hypothetical protein
MYSRVENTSVEEKKSGHSHDMKRPTGKNPCAKKYSAEACLPCARFGK